MLYRNNNSSSISNLVLYPRSGFGGKIFVLGSIRFNRESIDSRFLHKQQRRNNEYQTSPAKRQACASPREHISNLRVYAKNSELEW